MQTIALILLMSGGAGADGKGGGMNIQFFTIPLIIIIFYFFMLRPQTQKAKEAKNLKDTIQKGDRIVTIGGVHCKITEIKDTTFIVEVGNGMKMEIEKSAVSLELTKALNTPNKAVADKK